MTTTDTTRSTVHKGAKPLLAAAVATGVLLGGVALSGSTAATYGDDRPCATPRELNAVNPGMRKAKVRSIIDTPGTKSLTGSYPNGVTYEERWYPACWGEGNDVLVVYHNGRVQSLSLYWPHWTT